MTATAVAAIPISGPAESVGSHVSISMLAPRGCVEHRNVASPLNLHAGAGRGSSANLGSVRRAPVEAAQMTLYMIVPGSAKSASGTSAT